MDSNTNKEKNTEQKHQYVEFFLPHNVPSLKNNRIITKYGSFPSKLVKEYLKKFNIRNLDVNKNMYERITLYKNKPNLFYRQVFPYFKQIKEQPNFKYPIIIYFHFVRSSNTKFDFNNATQILTDLLSGHSLIEDDDMSHLITIPLQKPSTGEWYSVNKEKPGVWIRIIVD